MKPDLAAGEQPPVWSAREPGTSEHEWITGIPWADLPRLDLDEVARRWNRVLVVGAHPDDETLAVGAFMAALIARGIRFDVISLTDGEGSHGDVPALAPPVVGQVRRAELDAALTALGGVYSTTCVGLPDGKLATMTDAVRDALVAALEISNASGEPASRTLVLAPHPQDGHIDHDTAGAVAAEVARRCGADCVHYPLWAWHWGSPETTRWEDTVLVAPDASDLGRKAAALRCYPSQTGLFGHAREDPAVLPPAVTTRFERVVETLDDPDAVLPLQENAPFVGLTATSSFDSMFDTSDDPWGAESRWYERRKIDIVTAVLPHERVGRVLDLGCSTGALTARVAARADEVVALDASERALDVARRRPTRNVEWHRADLPQDLDLLPDASFDTILLSEVGYFFDGASLLRLFAAMDRLLAPDGVVVHVNWMHPTRDIPLDGRFVDRQVQAVWSPRARYEDDDVTVFVGHATHRGRKP